MADKHDFSDAFRDSFLNRNIEPETTDGWAAVCHTLRRRSVTRKVVTAASSLAVVTAVFIGIGLNNKDSVVPKTLVADTVIQENENVVSQDFDIVDSQKVDIVVSQNVGIVVSQNEKGRTVQEEIQDIVQDTEVIQEESSAREAEVPSEYHHRSKKVYSDIDTVGKRLLASNDPKTRKEYQLGFSARGMLVSTGSISNLSAGVIGILSKEWSKENTGTPRSMTKGKFQYKHYMPVGAGINIGIPVSKSLSIDTGIDYTMLHSERTVMGKTDQQYLHMLGIPLSLNWNKTLGKGFAFYAGGGAEMEKCLKATLGTTTVDEKQLQWSVFADFGFQYYIYRNLSIYLQPEFSYYFTDTSLETFRSGSGFGISARAGLRIGL